MFNLFGKKEKKNTWEELNVDDQSIVAMADGELIDIHNVPDEMFAKKLMGETTAFQFSGDNVTICSPANGTLSVLFPTAHAFGIQMKDGMELLVHIGINTVESNGEGFKIVHVEQGDIVKAGQPIVEVDFKKLSKKYNMSTMLIITNDTRDSSQFIESTLVKRGDSVLK